MSRTEPVSPRDAATVVLVRDGADGVEVFLQRRVQQMPFAGGMTVFPGGGVDARDGDADIAWIGPEPHWWAQRFGSDERAARQLVCAAARETFEECGVLLATDADGGPPDTPALDGERARLESRDVHLAGFLREHRLVLRTDLLRPLAHWITPKAEKRRYDTRFFLAAMPEGQVADDHSSEVDEAGWCGAAQALRDFTAGTRFLLPPTWAQLRTLAAAGSVAELLAAEPVIGTVEPVLGSGGGLDALSFDGSDEYVAALPPALRSTAL